MISFEDIQRLCGPKCKHTVVPVSGLDTSSGNHVKADNYRAMNQHQCKIICYLLSQQNVMAPDYTNIKMALGTQTEYYIRNPIGLKHRDSCVSFDLIADVFAGNNYMRLV